jgi:hypothetical protein
VLDHQYVPQSTAIGRDEEDSRRGAGGFLVFVGGMTPAPVATQKNEFVPSGGSEQVMPLRLRTTFGDGCAWSFQVTPASVVVITMASVELLSPAAQQDAGRHGCFQLRRHDTELRAPTVFGAV